MHQPYYLVGFPSGLATSIFLKVPPLPSKMKAIASSFPHLGEINMELDGTLS
jgi:hypothetical protein